MMLHPQRWLIVTVATIIIAAGVLVVSPPTFGINFIGGSLIEIATTAETEIIRSVVSDELQQTVTATPTASGTVLIRTIPLSPDQQTQVTDALAAHDALQEVLRIESIGPTIGQELRRRSWIAGSAALAAIIIYLAYTFRKTSGLISSWKFGVAAAGALLHDVLVVTAIFALLSRYTSATIDTLFVSAMLAIVGYSVNDTIVLFNRFKAVWLTDRSLKLPEALTQALARTLVRSLNTSATTLAVLIVLLLFGGETIRWFVAALAIGTVVGTYSSLFVAPPLLHALAGRK